MGCGGSKKKQDVRNLRLERVGVYSIDAFNDEVTNIIEQFAVITDDIDWKRKRVEDATGFWWAKHQDDRTLANYVTGMLLQFYSVANGNVS